MSDYSESLPCLEKLVRKRRFFSLLHFSRFCRLAGVQLQGFLLVLLGMECGCCFLCPSWPCTLQGLSPRASDHSGSSLNFLISWLLGSKRKEATASDPLLGSAVSEHLFCGLCSGCIPGPARGVGWQLDSTSRRFRGELVGPCLKSVRHMAGVRAATSTGMPHPVALGGFLEGRKIILQQEFFALKGPPPALNGGNVGHEAHGENL